MRLIEWLKSWFTDDPIVEEEIALVDGIDKLFSRALKYKRDREELLKACKLLLCVYYGEWGPLGEADIARFAEMLVERTDGKPFDARAWILGQWKGIRLDQ